MSCENRRKFLSDEGATLETLDFAFYIGSTPTFLYFDLYLNTTYAAHYTFIFLIILIILWSIIRHSEVDNAPRDCFYGRAFCSELSLYIYMER